MKGEGPSADLFGEGIEQSYVVLDYVAKTWDEEQFQKTGAVVAVVLNYNKRHLISHATRSALCQDAENYEILCLDDCSQDGSEQEMLSVVREFVELEVRSLSPKPIRIKVVFNRKNRTILGQWSLAAKISTGFWFGMFCGDDVARVNRITDIRELIAEYPTAWGICTNMAVGNEHHPRHEFQRMVWRGDCRQRPMPVLSGCTAFWHRRCFDKRLPAFNIDDSFLYWTVVIRAQGLPCPILVWAYDKVGVDYNDTSGISTSYLARLGNGCWPLLKVRRYYAVRAHDRKYGLVRWREILSYDCEHGIKSYVREQISGLVHLARLRSGGWHERLCEFWKIQFLDRKCSYGGLRKCIVKAASKVFVYYFLGVISYVALSTVEDVYHLFLKKTWLNALFARLPKHSHSD